MVVDTIVKKYMKKIFSYEMSDENMMQIDELYGKISSDAKRKLFEEAPNVVNTIINYRRTIQRGCNKIIRDTVKSKNTVDCVCTPNIEKKGTITIVENPDGSFEILEN